jgi:hypothetical protein
MPTKPSGQKNARETFPLSPESVEMERHVPGLGAKILAFM